MRKYIGTQRVPKAKSTVKAEVSREGKHQMDVEKSQKAVMIIVPWYHYCSTNGTNYTIAIWPSYDIGGLQ